MRIVGFKQKITAFTLIELLLVAAIAVVVAAFSIHSYMNYIIQTRVNALWEQADAAKLEVESKYLKQNVPVTSITVDSGTAEYTTSNVDFVKCITIQDGVVSVVGVPSKFNNQSVWISWTPSQTSEDIVWSCNYSTAAAPYVTDVSNTCAVQSCSAYSTWNAATTVDTQTIWYFGTLSQSDVATAFADNCRTVGSMSGCSSCYDFTNTDTEQRYMNFSLSNTTYNYSGALGSDPNWSSYTSWTYEYDYTIVTQSCMDQTRTASSCANTNPYGSDPACS
jgi:Tfp pilus assembly protein PilE